MKWPGIASRRALVTGGSRGIGRAIARTLVASGAEVIVTARTPESAERAAAELGPSARGVELDLSVPARAEQRLAELAAEIKQAGGLDLLVLNAGMTRDGLVMRMSLDQWQEVIDANLTGAYLVTKAFVPGMIRSRFGRIVLLSSVVARMGNAGQSNYAASKAGMIGFVRSLAREVASRGITVNAVAPGFVDTDMTRAIPEAARNKLLELVPLARLGEPEDIASAVAFLLSDAASYITGEVLDVNGGMDM
ncbi:MAG: 3-oxoacyl-[acyl-carrier-protein] reductase [Acidobacteriota bacterium]|nr:3-oxoacyl-[acyl-carrier-protein] reductase [Acidobacteriota bacterium]MDQ7086753.1 3-oxoacyl-[acyl-carrier-protein] reductase [Acidobacteriota bacterium]